MSYLTIPTARFVVRYPAPDGLYRFEGVDLDAPSGGLYPMEYPPLVGDLILLPEKRTGAANLEGGPVFRVIERMWSHAQYGSPYWPYSRPVPVHGPSLEIVVVPHEGIYALQAPPDQEN